MKKFIAIFCLIGSITPFINAQNIAINTTGADPDGSALLDIQATNLGLLVPRVSLTTTTAAGPVTSPAVSLLIYNTATVSDVTPGYYYWNGTVWVRFFDATVNATDHDWYEVGGTDAPNSINDNIFTQGNVGIGESAPSSLLHIKASNGAQAKGQIHITGNGGLGTGDAFISFEEGSEGHNWSVGHDDADNGFSISNNLNVSTNTRLFINSVGNVGIGTKSPLELLDVNGDMYLRGEDLYFSHDDGTNTNNDYLKYSDDNSILGGSKGIVSFHGDTTRGVPWTAPSASISARGGYFDGNVGIGTTSPSEKLELRVGKTDGNGIFISEAATSGFKIEAEYVPNTSNNKLHITSNGYGSDGEKLTIKADGNVGIGTTTPNEKLEINGAIRITDGNEGAGKILVSDANGTGSWQDASAISPSSMEDADGDTKIQVEENSDDDNIRFDTRGSERMIVDSLGRVGIGTTTPTTKLDIAGRVILDKGQGATANGSDIFMSASGLIAAEDDLHFNANGDGVGSTGDFHFRQGSETATATELVIIKNDGKVGVGVSSPLEQMDINGDMYLRGDDIYFSHDGAGNANNDYITYNDGTHLGSTGVFSLYSDVSRGMGWAAPTAALSANGGYFAGNLGVGTSTPAAKLDIFRNNTIGDFGGQNLSNAALRIQDAKALLYVDGNTIYSNTDGDGMNISTLDSANIRFGTFNQERLTITGNGNVGIGIATPTQMFEVSGGDMDINQGTYFLKDNATNVYGMGYNTEGGSQMTLFSDHLIQFTESDANDVRVHFDLNSGYVGIGTTSPGELLEVAGNVKATSFIATTSGAGAYKYNTATDMTVPDYVFEKHFIGKSSINPEYKMNTLKEVEMYIKKHHHLPRVPSRDHLQKEGAINLQGMQMITLEKVEELFIHTINQEKENKILKDQVIAQKKEFTHALNTQKEIFENKMKAQQKQIDALLKIIEK